MGIKPISKSLNPHTTFLPIYVHFRFYGRISCVMRCDVNRVEKYLSVCFHQVCAASLVTLAKAWCSPVKLGKAVLRSVQPSQQRADSDAPPVIH